MRKPHWVRPREAVAGGHGVRKLLRDLDLSTVCESARCPNRGECFTDRTATFLILGKDCTRRGGFCAVDKGAPTAPDPGEGLRIAAAVRRLGLDFVVVTSVTRDDLADGGASVFAEVIDTLRREVPGVPVEVLVPDFQGSGEALETVLDRGVAVLNHNVETVPRLYGTVRPGADYGRSLGIIGAAARHRTAPIAKSGLMLGLGERRDEVLSVMDDLASAGCRCLTLGQYLQPTGENLPVERFLAPAEFEEFAEEGRRAGIELVVAGPLVRSSYRAGGTLRSLAGPGHE